MLARHGMPSVIICDNGPQFTNDKLYEWIQVNGVRIVLSAPFWSQANGEVEKQNRNLLKRQDCACGKTKLKRGIVRLLTYV